MWHYIRKKLGLANVEAFDSTQAQILARISKIEDDLMYLRSDLTVTYFDEMDPKRKSASDRLAQKMIEKLEAEDKARRHTLGEL